jgi:hypothetical protein
MPNSIDSRVPSYRLYQQSGQARVTLNGRDILLGKYGTAASKAEYNRVIGEWIAAGRQPSQALSRSAENWFFRTFGETARPIFARLLDTFYVDSILTEWSPRWMWKPSCPRQDAWRWNGCGSTLRGS